MQKRPIIRTFSNGSSILIIIIILSFNCSNINSKKNIFGCCCSKQKKKTEESKKNKEPGPKPTLVLHLHTPSNNPNNVIYITKQDIKNNSKKNIEKAKDNRLKLPKLFLSHSEKPPQNKKPKLERIRSSSEGDKSTSDKDDKKIEKHNQITTSEDIVNLYK
ncbi:MAG: hypothetical protein GY830_06615 [Bacteroidetes bacterium]|nr:hypothetical protein [Bacteroidota bacterium]